MKQLKPLYKKDVTGKIREITFYYKDNMFWAEHGVKGGQLIKDNPTICEPKNVGRSNETTAKEQAELEAQARWQKKVDTGYFVNLEDVNKQLYFKPMLAHKWEDHQDKALDAGMVISQPKLDGIRCIARWEEDKIVCRSRNGKEIVPVQKIRDLLAERLPRGLTLDGELYNHDYKENFNKIVSLVRKTKPSQKDIDECADLIQYHVYDCFVEEQPELNFVERIVFLNDNMTFTVTDSIKQVESIHMQGNPNVTSQMLTELYGEYMQAGYEGQMVRLNGKYENKRSKCLLKRKEFKDDEFIIVDVEEGRGKRSGMAATLKMLTHDNKIFHGAIKGTDKFRIEMLTRKQEVINTKAHVRFFEYTPDGVPRFPVVHSVRDYE